MQPTTLPELSHVSPRHTFHVGRELTRSIVIGTCPVLRLEMLKWIYSVDVRSLRIVLTFPCGMHFKALYARLFLFHGLLVSDSLRSITPMYPRKKIDLKRIFDHSFAILRQTAVIISVLFSRFPFESRKHNYVAQFPFRFKSLLIIVKFSNWLFIWRQVPSLSDNPAKLISQS